MPAASILIKPASSACNIACKYCFYQKLTDGRQVKNYGKMTLETAEQLVKNAIDYADDFVCFAFQGGEPTLAGLDFYREVIKFQQKYNTKNLEIQNTIQTNGTLIDEEWAKFLGEHHFLVGLSLDGGKSVNDYCRVDAKGESIFAREMETIELLERYRVDYNIVSVVTAKSVEKLPFIYQFFKKKGFRYLQFIPCMDEKRGEKSEFSLTPEAYGAFLCELFDLWYEDFVSGYQIDIRMFSNLAQMAAGYQPEECGMCGHCTTYFVVEADGSVYPCDFYAVDEWKLGTVKENFKDLYEGELSQKFMKDSNQLSEKCLSCRHFALCRGGCRRWREPLGGEEDNLNYLCPGFELFFEHCSERIAILGEYIRRKEEKHVN